MTKWNLSIQNNWTEKSALIWAEEQIKSGVPRQVVCNYLLKNNDSIHFNRDGSMDALLNVEFQVFSVMVNRNLEGQYLEKMGNIEEAIKIYEANLADWFVGPFPYDRLRIILTKQKRFDEAIKVCKAHIKMDTHLVSVRGYRSPTRLKCVHWIEVLEKKKMSK